MVATDRLIHVLATFARALLTDYPVDEMLATFCADIGEVLDVDGAGVMLEVEGGDLRFVAASDDIVRYIEVLQIELGEGPCLASYRTGEINIIPDLAVDDEFPAFSPRALKAGMGAVLSFPLVINGDCVGALNLYAASPSAASEVVTDAGRLLADVATAYIINSRTLAESHTLTEQLQRALDSRVVIEQAKGKLSEQLEIPVSAAFETLRRYARSNGRKLRDVAAEVVAGQLRLPGPQ